MAKKPPTKTSSPTLPQSQKADSASPPDTIDTEIAAEIDRQIGSLVPQSQRGQIVARVVRVLHEEKFSGPIAHPRHLREYESIVPGSADRIIRMAEKAIDHQAEMDKKIVDAEVKDQRLGMLLGFIALLIILALAALFGYWDRPSITALFLGAAALGSIAVFVRGRNGGKPPN